MGMHAMQVGAAEGLLARLEEARRLTDDLFQVVRSDSLYERTIRERHRIVFYIGHLEAFDWNLLAPAAGLAPFQPEYDRLFAFGIDPVDGQLPSDKPSDWPTMDRIREYCGDVRKRLDDALHSGVSGPEGGPLADDRFRMNVAIEHRLMHAETLGYILHHLPQDRKVSRMSGRIARRPNLRPDMIEVPLGMATLGLPRGGRQFGWCNEFSSHRAEVPEFRIDRLNVTNAQFLEFMADGGYRRPELWRRDNWKWREREGIEHPYFWTRKDAQWLYRGMFSDVPLPADWPVYVSHAEAEAYCHWRGLALPTEAQFHRAAYGTPEGEERHFPWGAAPPQSDHGNFDFYRWDPAPVGSFPAGDSAFGVADLLGNGWEWTGSLFEPFEGFAPFPYYPGYSANFFDGQHFVLKGGSPLTAACMLRRSFRNWFQPRYPYTYATLRCVENF